MAQELLNRQEAFALVQDFLDRVAVMDFDGVSEMLTEDGECFMPFTPGGAVPLKGRENFRETMNRTVPPFLASIAFTIDGSYFDAEKQRVILEYHSQGMRTDGKPYANVYVGTWDLEGDKISRWQEYYNPENLK